MIQTTVASTKSSRWRFAWAWFMGTMLVLPLPACDNKDRDGDGVPDVIDQCPDVPGTGANLGCPVVPPSKYDCDAPPTVARQILTVENPIKDEYIVMFSTGSRDSQSVSAFTAKHDLKPLTVFGALGGMHVKVSKLDVLAKLLADPTVRYVQQNGVKKVTPLRSLASVGSWGLDRVDQADLPLDGKFEPGATGEGVHLYVIDTGIQTAHVEFAGRIGEGYSAVGGSFEDDHDHGSHVAGTAGGTTFGIAKKVVLHPVRVLINGSGTDADVIEGIDWAVNHATSNGWRAVFNLSLGGGVSQALDESLCRARAARIVVAVAAGNEEADACGGSPAHVVQLLTTGAMQEDDAGADFTNYGQCVDLFAPGVNINSAKRGGGSQLMSGTSMASPHVAGAAALYLQRHPAATVDEALAAIVASATKDTLTDIGTGSPNLMLYVNEDHAPPRESPRIVDGRWVPFLRGATNCCEDESTPDMDEGLVDGWALVSAVALDRIKRSGTIDWTHVRLGPFSELSDASISALAVADQRRARILRKSILKYGPGYEILDDARVSGQAATERGITLEWDVVDGWALATRGMNFYDDDCSVTQAAPPQRYLDWVQAVVDATWDFPGTYNLGNEGFRCRPSVAWERGLYDALKAALAAKGVSRPIGSTVTVADTRTAFDYRTYHGFFVPPAGWSRDIPAMLTETDNDFHDAAAWIDLAKRTEAQGGYISIWRGPDSWDTQNAAIAGMPKLGDPPPPPPPGDNCPKPLAEGAELYLNDNPFGQGFDSTPRVRGDAEFCRLIHGVATNDCHLEGWPKRTECELELLGASINKPVACPVWEFQDAGGKIRCEDDGTQRAGCDHFGDPVHRDDPQTPDVFEGQPAECGLQRDPVRNHPSAGFFTIAHGKGEVRACKPDGTGCGPWRAVDH